MPRNETIALSGKIHNVFAHRFIPATDGRVHLADVGPKGAELFRVAEGLDVTIEGERRPSEINVSRISATGGHPASIHHQKPHHASGAGAPLTEADVARALEAAVQSGWAVRGALRRKPKHVEVLGRKNDGARQELHIDVSGTVYKQTDVDSAKWGSPIA